VVQGTLNATPMLPGYLLAGQPIALIGPDPTGLIGSIGYLILALVLFAGIGFAGRKETIPEDNEVNSRDSRLVYR